MSESQTGHPPDPLISTIRASFAPDGIQTFLHLVLYTSFGVVRGRTSLSFTQELLRHQPPEIQASKPEGEVIELHDVSVEHYSNHLATANFDRLYVRLPEVRGFAIVGTQGQS